MTASKISIGNHTDIYWHVFGKTIGMKKWFLVAVNVLLGMFVILIASLQRISNTEKYDEITTYYIPRILLSFTAVTFLTLVLSGTGHKTNK